jgi:hypothetical protein
MQHPSRKRDAQSEASAARVLQWARATRQRVVAEQPAGGGGRGGGGGGGGAAAAAPTPLGAHDDDMRQTLQQMLKETPLEDITPHMLKARQEHACRAGRGGAGTKVLAYWYNSTNADTRKQEEVVAASVACMPVVEVAAPNRLRREEMEIRWRATLG